MGGIGGVAAIGLSNLQSSRRSGVNFMEAIKKAEGILKENGFDGLLEVGVAGSNDGLMLMGDFPLNGGTAEAYLRAKGQILKTVNLDLFAYERIENNRVIVTVV